LIPSVSETVVKLISRPRDHLLFNDDVGHAAALEDNVVVAHCQRHLTPKRYTGSAKFAAQAFLVDRFRQARTEPPMHLHRQSNNLIGKLGAWKAVSRHAPDFVRRRPYEGLES
jgi:hypothetical protein